MLLPTQELEVAVEVELKLEVDLVGQVNQDLLLLPQVVVLH